MERRPEIVNRSKSSSHPLKHGRFYTGTVTAVLVGGRINIKIPELGTQYGPLTPLNTTSTSRYIVGDSIKCGFADEFFNEVIVFGSTRIKEDVFAVSENGIDRFADSSARDYSIPVPSEGRVIYVLDSDELQIYNGTTWVTVIDTGSSENISVSTLVATSASIGTLTVTGASTLNVLGASNLSASTTIGTITPTELSYLDGATSAIQTQINAKAPLANPTLASPTLTGVPVAPTAAAGTSTTQLATTAFVTTADNLKAPLASPTFTGIPTAPTAIAGTITTQLATTAFVTTADNLKAPSASPTFTGVVTLPSTTSIGTVSSTELGYIDGVTSPIQTQIDTKSPSASPTFTGVVTLPSTTSIGTVSSTELGYMDGVTSGVQAQINSKAPSASPTFTGTVVLPDNTVTSGMIANGAVTQAKLASSLSAVTATTSSLLSTAIPSPFNGQFAYETDTRYTKVYDGSAWRFVSFASQYKVGDTGPGGGIIFYVDRFNEYSDFNYLEIASDSTRVLRPWAQSTPINYQSTAVSGAGRFALGTGSLNTTEIVAQGNSNPATCAATYCDSLVSGGQSDWYLGSLAEMKLANEVLHQSFSTSWYSGYYWTSTQYSADQSFYMQALAIGNLNGSVKSTSFDVRAIRKFS